MSDLAETVLIVDDEAIIGLSLRMQVEQMGLPVCGIASTAPSAVALAQLHRPRIVLMDVRLRGDQDGVDAALAIHETVGSKVIFITGSQESATRARIAQDHPAAILFKPLSERQLEKAIRSVLQS